jgi:hypothetical protein
MDIEILNSKIFFDFGNSNFLNFIEKMSKVRAKELKISMKMSCWPPHQSII